METAVLEEIERLRRVPVAELLIRYREVFGEETNSRHREQLFRKIAWRLQAQAEGGLTDRARERAGEIARDADLRVIAPKGFFSAGKEVALTVPRNGQKGHEDRRLPIAGTLIKREFQGRVYFVEVLSDGFRYEGRHHRSLSSVAREITGTRWNGLAFFGYAGKTKSKLGRIHAGA